MGAWIETMDEEYVVILEAVSTEDPSKDVSITKTVTASSQQEAIEKAKEAARHENPEFNLPENWCWSVYPRFVKGCD